MPAVRSATKRPFALTLVGSDPPTSDLLLETTDRLLRDTVESLHRLEMQADASSWEKAEIYVTAYDALKKEPGFEGLSGQMLTRRINKRLVAVAQERKRSLPALSFLAHARKLADTWGEIFGFETKLLPYQHYRQLAVCALPSEEKKELRDWAERDQPTQETLRQTIRTAVDAHNGIHRPDFARKPSNFWKFDSPHDNDAYGGIHPEVVANLLDRFTEPGDVVLDPMAGTGILAHTLANYRFFREAYGAEGSGPRAALMCDIAPTQADIVLADATVGLPFEEGVADFALVDPPYFRIADSKRYQNLGHTLEAWLAALQKIIINTARCVKPNGFIAVITDDVLRKDEHEPIADHILGLMRDVRLPPIVTIYNHVPNFIFTMGPAQMAAARRSGTFLNGCKIIRVAQRIGEVRPLSDCERLRQLWAKAAPDQQVAFLETLGG